MAPDIEWELWRTFLAVLEAGSLSGAARELGIAQPTAGRHVAALERALGTVLFTRSPTGLIATVAAEALRRDAAGMRSTAAALARTAVSTRAVGTVRLAASEIVGVELLPDILATLAREHPALEVELVLSNRVQDLLRREADVAVRMVRPAQDALVARRVGAIEVGLHAHADYLARRGTPCTVDELAGHTLIGVDQSSPHVRAIAGSLPWIDTIGFGLRADSDLAQLALIRAGAGIGFCQAGFAGREPALVRVLKTAVSVSMEMWIAMHEDLRSSARCRIVFDALVAGLSREQAITGDGL